MQVFSYNENNKLIFNRLVWNLFLFLNFILNYLLVTDNEDLIEDRRLSQELTVLKTHINLQEVKESVIWSFKTKTRCLYPSIIKIHHLFLCTSFALPGKTDLFLFQFLLRLRISYKTQVAGCDISKTKVFQRFFILICFFREKKIKFSKKPRASFNYT